MSVTVQTGNSVAIQTGNRVIITAPGPQGPPGSGGGGTPGGTNTQVQFNDSSSFGGDAGLTYNKTTDTLSATNLTVSGLSTLAHIHGSIAGNLYVHVKNTSGVTIAKGTPVYATGSVGTSGEIEVAAADHTNSAKMPAIGITDAQLIANAEGNAVVVGEITGLATNSYAINQELFVGTAGLLGALPTTGEAQSIAVVSRVHASTGIIVVNAQARLNAALRALANNVGSGLTALNASSITSGSLADAYIASAATWNAKQAAGNYITALTGDVTASGPGSVAATIANNAVTYAKIQDVSAASRLLGRGDSGSGDAQEITLGTNLSMSGTTLNASGGGVTDGDKGDITVSSSGTVWTIDNGVVSYAKMQDVSAASKLIGRGDSGSGDPQEITIGSGLAMTGTTLSATGTGSGDMTKAVYDPQDVGYISGATGAATNSGTGGIGGVLFLYGGNGDTNIGGLAGTVITVGGNGDATGNGGNGGDIDTRGGIGNDGGHNGGSINTSGNLAPGGSINTSDGGGSISTRGTGSVGLGASGTRTTVTGTATADRAIAFPNASGTIALTSDITGTNSGTNTGDVTLAGTPDYITITGQTITRNAIDLATDVTGTLPIANGGTGQTTQTAAFDALAPTTTKGDLIVHNGSDNVRLPVGTDGHSLVADSTQASGVKWAAGGGGSSGAMVLLASATASSSAEILFDNEFDSSLYSEYVLKFQGVQPATDNVDFRVQLRNSTPANITDFHRNNHLFGRIDATAVPGNTANLGNTTGWLIVGGAGNAANELSSGNLHIQPNSGQWTHTSGLLYYSNSTSNQRFCITFAGACEGTTAPAGVRIYMSSGNISIGTFQLYGITK